MQILVIFQIFKKLIKNIIPIFNVARVQTTFNNRNSSSIQNWIQRHFYL
jgi:hypothetical protein